MVVRMDGYYIMALSQICEEYFDQSEYSIGGPKESAVCLEKYVDGWVVYEKEKNSQNDVVHYDDEQKACVDFLRRLSTISDFALIEEKFREGCKAKRRRCIGGV